MTTEKVLYDALQNMSYDVYPQYSPQNTSNPVVIYNVSADDVITGTNCASDAQQTRFQIDLYHDRYDGIKKMKDDLFDALTGITAGQLIIYGSVDSANEDGRRTKVDIKIWL